MQPVIFQNRLDVKSKQRVGTAFDVIVRNSTPIYVCVQLSALSPTDGWAAQLDVVRKWRTVHVLLRIGSLVLGPDGREIWRKYVALSGGEIAAVMSAMRQEALALSHQLIFDEWLADNIAGPLARIKGLTRRTASECVNGEK